MIIALLINTLMSISFYSFAVTLIIMLLITLFDITVYRAKHYHLIFVQMAHLFVTAVIFITYFSIVNSASKNNLTFEFIYEYNKNFTNIIDEDNYELFYDLLAYIIIIFWDTGILFIVYLSLLIIYSTGGNCKKNALEGTLPEPIYDQFAFLIVCHNSSDRIEKTIKHILKSCPFDYNNIFISDNGSTPEECNLTKEISDRYKCKYLSLSKGSKTLSQFATSNYINIHHREIKYIIALDDDINLPDSWDFYHVYEHFLDKNVTALAIPLIASNKVNFLTECQNLEYLMAGYNKIFQDKIGTCLFGSGGFTVYRLSYFIEVISHHTTAFRGEDLQLGLLTHSISDYHTMNNKKFTPKISCCSEIFVGTDVPVHYYHREPKCECGEPSFFNQRVSSWEVTRHRFIMKFANVFKSHCFSLKHMTTWHVIMIKIYSLYELILVINDWVVIIYTAIILFIYFGWATILRAYLISTVINIPLLLLFKYTFWTKFNVPLFVIFGHSFYYKFNYNFIVRILSVFRNMFFYWPNYREPRSIAHQYATDNDFNTVINKYMLLHEVKRTRKISNGSSVYYSATSGTPRSTINIDEVVIV